MAQTWIAQRLDEENHVKFQALMSGPLETTIPPKPPPAPGKRVIQPPWWWGTDEDVSMGNKAAMMNLGRQRK